MIHEVSHILNHHVDSIPLVAGVIVMTPKPSKPPTIDEAHYLSEYSRKILLFIFLRGIELDVESIISHI